MLSTAEFETETFAAPSLAAPSLAAPRWSPGNGVVCPFCGSVHAGRTARCPQCSLEDTPATRAATKSRVGSWYPLRDPNVAARGMTFQTLTSLVQRNIVVPESIVRGPATHQLWRWAGRVKGLSREMGFCYTCGESLGTTAETCPHCNRSQTPPLDAELVERVPQPTSIAPTSIAPTSIAPNLTAPRDTPSAHRRTVAGEKFIPRERDPRDVFPAPEPSLFDRPDPAPGLPRPPREDLLTPTDVAKAFSLSFDFSGNPAAVAEPAPRPLPATLTLAAKPTKVTVAVLAVFAGAWVVEATLVPRLLAARIVATAWVESHLHRGGQTRSVATPAAPTELASARFVAIPVTNDVPSAAPARFTEPSSSATAPVLAEPTPVASPADDVHQLWAAALDAESRRDFVDAVRNYERIRSLPDTTWPTGLATRIQLARQEQVAGTY